MKVEDVKAVLDLKVISYWLRASWLGLESVFVFLMLVSIIRTILTEETKWETY